MDTIKLYYPARLLILEALRRYTRFHRGEVLTEAWTGLGTATEFNPAVRAGLMTVATSPNPGHMTWWKLTPKGAAIVEWLIQAGFTYEHIESGNLPDGDFVCKAGHVVVV